MNKLLLNCYIDCRETIDENILFTSNNKERDFNDDASPAKTFVNFVSDPFSILSH